jgi:hypothetical protein
MVSATYNDISSMPMLEQYPRILKKFEKASAGEVLASEFEEAVGQIAFPAIIREIQSDRKGVYLSRKGDVLYDPVWGSRPSTAFSFGLKTWKEHAEKYESLSPKQKKLYDASVKAGGENVIHDWAKDTWDMERAGVSEKDRAAYVLKMKEWFDKEMWKDPHYFTKNTLPKYKKAAKKYASKALSKEAKSKLEEFEDLEDKEKAAKRTDKRSAL